MFVTNTFYFGNIHIKCKRMQENIFSWGGCMIPTRLARFPPYKTRNKRKLRAKNRLV